MLNEVFRDGKQIESPNRTLQLRFHVERNASRQLVLTVLDRETGEVYGTYTLNPSIK